ncbi:lipoprotein, MAG6090 family [Mycoplasmopsis agalactiae]|uniref:lipoprotein, MAG6090 family n=1 Tax=Mycoplasmopsis agalactiae TaxID=2110 RepID=UPI001F3B6A65|nr:hypothetical protein [Mycoplasmopsis agalactiae]MCE6115445.1 hypothetical protein [Mycoplasmopsis agalactiae]
MKKKLLLSSGILALASPFISATCVVRNKSENDNPAASPAPNPVTPPTSEPVTPPNTHPNTPPSVQPAPNPVTPPNTTPADQPAPNPGTNPNTEPILPNTTPVTPAPAKKDIKAEWNNIFRDSPTGADIFWHPSKEQLEKEHVKKHEYASAVSTLRLFDDTYTNDKKAAWDRIWSWEPLYNNISSKKDFTKEYKESLSKQKDKLLADQKKAWDEVDRLINNNDKYLSLIRSDLEAYKTD